MKRLIASTVDHPVCRPFRRQASRPGVHSPQGRAHPSRRRTCSRHRHRLQWFCRKAFGRQAGCRAQGRIAVRGAQRPGTGRPGPTVQSPEPLYATPILYAAKTNEAHMASERARALNWPREPASRAWNYGPLPHHALGLPRPQPSTRTRRYTPTSATPMYRLELHTRALQLTC